MQEIQIGTVHEETLQVSEENIAPRYVPDTPKGFATPALVALIELTAANAIKNYLDSGETTVGTALDLKHTAPTPIGMSVRCQVTLVKVDRRRVVFEIVAWDDNEQICQGRHERFVLDAERFNTTIQEKLQ